ncbi:STAS domain-containing protein [Streptomyces sp. NPDC093595]|uniref:STAS domain-containing protein n=1 Tax=Streptomyces sp. NPDC093595 TaxID=3366045 RepID=UPI0037F9CC87
MSTAQISITTTPLDERTLAIALAGELDIDTAELIEPALSRLTGTAPRELVLDLADVSFCDSSAPPSSSVCTGVARTRAYGCACAASPASPRW